VLQHPDVVDCAVVGVDDSLKGVVPLALCVLRNGEATPSLQGEFEERDNKNQGLESCRK